MAKPLPGPTDARPRRRGRRAVAVLLLAGLSAFCLWMFFQIADTATPNTPTRHADDTLTWRPGDATVGPNPSTLTPGVDPLHLNPRHTPLASEPANLPPHPDATHQSRYTTAAGGLIDETSFWNIRTDHPGDDLDAIEKHYRDVALAAGFVQSPSDASKPGPGRTLLFTDGGSQWRTLTVRLTPRRNAVHVTVWLRYAMANP